MSQNVHHSLNHIQKTALWITFKKSVKFVESYKRKRWVQFCESSYKKRFSMLRVFVFSPKKISLNHIQRKSSILWVKFQNKFICLSQIAKQKGSILWVTFNKKVQFLWVISKKVQFFELEKQFNFLSHIWKKKGSVLRVTFWKICQSYQKKRTISRVMFKKSSNLWDMFFLKTQKGRILWRKNQ